jgi:hypothetical protein
MTMRKHDGRILCPHGARTITVARAVSSIQDSYSQDYLHLTVVKGYLRKLITNDRVARYLEQYQPELLIEFQKIADMTSTLPSEAA